MLKPVLDLLMAAGRIADDRNVRQLEAEFSAIIVGTRIEIRRADGALVNPPKVRSGP